MKPLYVSKSKFWMKLEKTGPKINYYSHSAACTIQYVYWGFEEADIAYSLVLLSILFNTCAATGGRHFWKTFKNRLEKQQNGCFKLLNSILAVVHTSYRQKKAHNTVFSQKKIQLVCYFLVSNLLVRSYTTSINWYSAQARAVKS